MSGRRSVLAGLVGVLAGMVLGLLRRRPAPTALPLAVRGHDGPDDRVEGTGASTLT